MKRKEPGSRKESGSSRADQAGDLHLTECEKDFKRCLESGSSKSGPLSRFVWTGAQKGWIRPQYLADALTGRRGEAPQSEKILHLENVVIGGVAMGDHSDTRLDLNRREVNLIARFKHCRFESGISMRHARAEDFSFVGCEFGTYKSVGGRYRSTTREQFEISLDAYGARFQGRLVFVQSSEGRGEAHGVINIGKAEVSESLNFRGAKIKANPVSVDAGGLKAQSVYMSRGFEAEGTVYAHEATVSNTFSAEGGSFGVGYDTSCSEKSKNMALCLRYAKIGGLLQLGGGFRSCGVVDLKEANVKGPIDLWGGCFKNPFGVALLAHNLRAGADVFCAAPPDVNVPGYHNHYKSISNGKRARGTEFYGEVSLANAEIAGEVDFARVLVQGPRLDEQQSRQRSPSSIALSLYRARIGGRLRLGRGFRADGIVALEGARIDGSLDLQGGWFLNPDGIAIAANRVVVGGDIVLSRKWTRSELDSKVGFQDRNRCQPASWKLESITETRHLAQALLRESAGINEADDVEEDREESVEALTLLIEAFVNEHEKESNEVFRPRRIVGLLQRRFVSLGLVSFKAARVDGDIDLSGSLFFARQLNYSQASDIPDGLRSAIEERRGGEVANWKALDVSHVLVRRALFLTRWVPRNPSSGSGSKKRRSVDSPVYPVAVSGVVDLTASDVHQLHITPRLFSHESKNGDDARTSVVLVEGLTYGEIHDDISELAKCNWFFNQFEGSTSQPHEELSLALRRQGHHKESIKAFIHSVDRYSQWVGKGLQGAVWLLFPWWRSLLALVLLTLVGTLCAYRMMDAGGIQTVANANFTLQATTASTSEPPSGVPVDEATTEKFPAFISNPDTFVSRVSMGGDSAALQWYDLSGRAVRYSAAASIPLVPMPSYWREVSAGAHILNLILNVLGVLLTFTLAIGIASVFRKPDPS